MHVRQVPCTTRYAEMEKMNTEQFNYLWLLMPAIKLPRRVPQTVNIWQYLLYIFNPSVSSLSECKENNN